MYRKYLGMHWMYSLQYQNVNTNIPRYYTVLGEILRAPRKSIFKMHRPLL